MTVSYNGVKIGNYAMYLNFPFPSLLSEKYKGIIVVVDKDENCSDSKFIHFRLDKGNNELLYKTRREKLDKIIFNDADLSITCEYKKHPKNNTPTVLTFTEEEFEELSEELPTFMQECGCEFETVESEGVLELKFS